MSVEAIRQNTPSQMSSAEPQISRASAYHTPMNAAPTHMHIPNPSDEPNQTYR